MLVSKLFPGIKKVNKILNLSISINTIQSNKKCTKCFQKVHKMSNPLCHSEGLSRARRCDPDRAQASARTRWPAVCKQEIKFFPLHKKRGEKNLLNSLLSRPETEPPSRKAPVSKTQSKGRAINGASLACLVTQ